MIEHLIKNLVYPVYTFLRGSSNLRFLSVLISFERSSEGDQERLVRKQMTSLLQHCYNHVPYYREKMKEKGVRDFRELDQVWPMEVLPILDKETLRKNQPSLVSDLLPKRGVSENTSGGSTGQPVRFLQDRAMQEYSRAINLWFNSWFGLVPGSKEIRLWGSERDIFQGSIGFKNHMNNLVMRRRWLNAFRMGPENMKDFIARINGFKPDFIFAYAEAIYRLAQFIEKIGIEVHRPRCVITSAGVLFPFMREKIESIFHCPVYNYYGSREVGAIACECKEQKGLHVSSLTHHIEILRDDGTAATEGESGEIVITLMTNRSMPLVRYRIGDRGAIDRTRCRCGRSMFRLTSVNGRSSDMFVRKDGGLVHGEFFTHLLYHIPTLEQFQVIQESLDDIVFRLAINGSSLSLHQEEDIKHKVSLVMGYSVRVRFEYTNEIMPTASGKYRYTISKVRQEC